MASSEKAPNESARKLVFRRLREQIINMDYLPGMPLSENELARDMGVSRTPVREALILLSEVGLVNVYPKKGSFVAPLNSQDVIDAQFLRESIELHALSSIDFPVAPVTLSRIDANLEKQKQAVDSGSQEFFPLDEEFHRLLLELSGHGRLWEIVNDYKSHLDRARILGLQTKPALKTFYQDHVRIVAAIKAEDLSTARTELQEHLRVVLEDLRVAQTSYTNIFLQKVPK